MRSLQVQKPQFAETGQRHDGDVVDVAPLQIDGSQRIEPGNGRQIDRFGPAVDQHERCRPGDELVADPTADLPHQPMADAITMFEVVLDFGALPAQFGDRPAALPAAFQTDPDFSRQRSRR